MALACAIGSTPELDAGVVVLAVSNVEVVKATKGFTALEGTLGEAVGSEGSAEGLLEVNGEIGIGLEEGYSKEDAFDEGLRFKRGPAKGGWICGYRCGSGCLVAGGSAVAVGTTREV